MMLEVTDLKCPYCGNENTKVIDSRPTDESAIRRRRQCESCGKRFTTYEKIETTPLIVIKKDNNREPYDREKLVSGIVRSCHKRPVSLSSINSMVDEIETQLYNMGEKEIPTTTIGMIVMDKLKELDQVAYVRFASVYKEFKDVNTFMDELKKILK
jgi:transcriptional repressor NrdR